MAMAWPCNDQPHGVTLISKASPIEISIVAQATTPIPKTDCLTSYVHHLSEDRYADYVPCILGLGA